MINKKITIIAVISLLVFQKCTFLDSNKNIKIVSQELIYDSLYKKPSVFNVNLYTTLEFKRNAITREEYNNFFVIISKDTFPLIPDINIKEKKSNNNEIKIKYTSLINFKSKNYENDSLSKIIIKDCKVINIRGQEIPKKDTYDFKSLIKFHKIKEDRLKYE
ncbi:hypothetical protein [Flavobacterium sp. ACAM 123]|uniref:hypothetical protein n=1 Tax=Flavobacterium sp. ACAM 123 TaxID=1189620 RepID=UPI00030E64C5|nr:hypothetical protein [Flavobacterium sp. ACAM 123]